MQYIKQEIQKGNLELAKPNGTSNPVPMDYSQLQKKKEIQDRRVQILQKLKQLSADQRKEWVYIKKLKANQLFKSKSFPAAIQAYLEAMLGLQISQTDKSKQQQQNYELKYPIMLNIATCFYKQKQYAKSLEMCRKIIEEEDGKNYSKVHYKKAYILIAISKYDQAIQTIKQGINSLSVDTSSSINKEDFLKLYSDIKDKSADQKNIYQNMFKKEDSDDEEQPLAKNGKQIQKSEQVLYYRDTWWQKLKECCRTSCEGVFSLRNSKTKSK